MPINTVIFDLDGTLLYTSEDLTDSVNFMLEKFGYNQMTIEQVLNCVGNGVDILIERVIPDGRNNPNYDKCLNTFKTHYSKNMFNKTKPYDDIIKLLTVLKEKGYKTAIVSNKFDNAVKSLSKKYFDGLITCSTGQSEEIPQKPAPDMVLKAIKELGSNLEDCILIGDSEVDIQTATNAGIPCISVVWGYKSIDFLYSNGATTILYSPMELMELI